MEVLNYNGQRVYTHSTNRVTEEDLQKAKQGLGTILDAFYFRIGPGRIVERTNFNTDEVRSNRIGLMVDVKAEGGSQASLAIAGLDRITDFLYDTNSLGTLSSLKGREVTEFHRGIAMLGIGIDEKYVVHKMPLEK